MNSQYRGTRGSCCNKNSCYSRMPMERLHLPVLQCTAVPEQKLNPALTNSVSKTSGYQASLPLCIHTPTGLHFTLSLLSIQVLTSFFPTSKEPYRCSKPTSFPIPCASPALLALLLCFRPIGHGLFPLGGMKRNCQQASQSCFADQLQGGAYSRICAAGEKRGMPGSHSAFDVLRTGEHRSLQDLTLLTFKQVGGHLA